MAEYKYVVQRRYQTELVKKVGDALGKVFDHLDGPSLHIREAITVVTSPKPLSKNKRNELRAHLLAKAKEEGDKETLSFECIPYAESIVAKAEGKGGI